MPQTHGQVWRGLAVGSKERPIFCGMLVDAHGYVESFFDIRYGALKLEAEAVARTAHDGKAARLREGQHCIKVFLAGTKALGKLFDRHELAVVGAGGIVDFLQKVIQLDRKST